MHVTVEHDIPHHQHIGVREPADRRRQNGRREIGTGGIRKGTVWRERPGGGNLVHGWCGVPVRALFREKTVLLKTKIMRPRKS